MGKLCGETVCSGLRRNARLGCSIFQQHLDRLVGTLSDANVCKCPTVESSSGFLSFKVSYFIVPFDRRFACERNIIGNALDND